MLGTGARRAEPPRGAAPMTRIVPHPLLTGGLVLMWLLLNRFSLGHLVLGTAVALVAGRAMAALEPVRPRIRRSDLILAALRASSSSTSCARTSRSRG